MGMVKVTGRPSERFLTPQEKAEGAQAVRVCSCALGISTGLGVSLLTPADPVTKVIIGLTSASVVALWLAESTNTDFPGY